MDPYKYRPSSAFNSPFCTTNSGAPVWNNNSSLTVGARGPVLLEDYHLVEKLANFDRERDERVVHARVLTPVIVRFSTVIHREGSPETLRDPRGFLSSFYTRDYEHMDGYGCPLSTLINKAEIQPMSSFHWKPRVVSSPYWKKRQSESEEQITATLLRTSMTLLQLEII
ncbi:catalase A [Datura stramonium]|uniref:Catalase A n=1 Tax=Datura stramonium TaxID=4076 RepID=A0ABS8RPJ2_DATST|nr:catalase A [Datura stramonium]